MLRLPAVALLLILALFAGFACNGGSDDDDDDATPTSDASATAASETPPASDEIRSLDLESIDDVQAFLDETGGTYVQDSVLYGDITGDGAEEAVVPVSSEGTAGDVAFIVLTPDGESARTLLMFDQAERGVVVTIEEGELVATEPVPGPDDPECCPSKLKVTVYRWNGSELVIEAENTIDSPGGGAKPPSSSE